jgi:hypothetical protein
MAIVWVSITWLTGIFAGDPLLLRTSHWLILSSLLFLAAVLLWRYPDQRWAFLMLLIFTIAAARSCLEVKELKPIDLAFYNDLDLPTRITGVVIEDPDYLE